MDTKEIKEFLDSMDLKTCFDTSHSKLYCNYADEDFYEQVEIILPYVSHLHLSDASGLDGEGLQIGEGTIDWVRFFEITKDYRGTMIPEIWRGHQRGGEGFIVAINRLTEYYHQALAK
jgi:N-acetylneuraminate synthase